MKQDCHYHPDTSARWQCLNCQLSYCSGCMPDARPRQRMGLCPHCGERLQYLGASEQIVPFWNRIPQFFRYPFHAAPLLVIAICTFIPAILTTPLVALVVSLFLFLALFKYAYKALSETAEGRLEPPPLATAFTGDGFALAFQQLAVFFLMGGLVWAAGLIGGGFLSIATIAFLVLALPASVMILAMEQSVMPAVNPINLGSLMARIGWPYFVLYAHLILLSMASGAAQQFAFQNMGMAVAALTAGFISSTFLLIFFHMMGYLLYQYQDALGYNAEGDEMDLPEPDRRLRFDADLDMHLKDGEYDRALSLIRSALKQEPQNPQRVEQLYRLLSATNDEGELYRNHPRILQWLSDRRDAAGVKAMLERLAAVEPRFRPSDPALEVDCARALYHGDEFAAVIRLLQDCHKRYSDSDQIAPACLLLAQSLAHGFDHWEKATAFLNYIKKRCEEHPLHEDIDTYLAQAARHEPLQGTPPQPFQSAGSQG